MAGVSGDSRSVKAYQGRQPGWYLVNQATGLAVAGPFAQQLTATKIKAAAERRWTDRGMDDWDELSVEHIHEAAK